MRRVGEDHGDGSGGLFIKVVIISRENRPRGFKKGGNK